MGVSIAVCHPSSRSVRLAAHLTMLLHGTAPSVRLPACLVVKWGQMAGRGMSAFDHGVKEHIIQAVCCCTPLAAAALAAVCSRGHRSHVGWQLSSVAAMLCHPQPVTMVLQP